MSVDGDGGCADPKPCSCTRCSGTVPTLRYTAAPTGAGECQVSLEGGLVLLRPCPPARPGNGNAPPAAVLVVELDVRLERAEEPGAWWVRDLDDATAPALLTAVPEPPPW